MLIRALAWLLLAVSAAHAQPTLVLRDPGPGEPGQLLGAALAQPYLVLMRADSMRTALPRDSSFDRTVIVFAPRTTVASKVRGDVIVIGGDLFLHPGASIDGRAVAIGGGVYTSTLADVRGGLFAFRDVTYDLTPVPGGFALSYRSLVDEPPVERFTLPLLFGVRVPEYTRVDGLAATWGPRIALVNGAVRIEPLVTYRSDLGALDPALKVRAELSSSWFVDGSAERATLSNDRWIRSDLVNSLSTLVTGRDARNYFRADRFEARLHRGWTGRDVELAASLGGRTERAWSVAAGGPWSMFGRNDPEDGIPRPNPSVRRGRLSSGLVGVQGGWSAAQVTLGFGVETELVFDPPGGGRFAQTTVDVRVDFPTFGTHLFSLESHAVVSTGDTVPPQRFAYLGGSGTLPTFDLLEMGGDQLFFVESRYAIPIEALRLPFAGAPVIILRHMLGAAGVGDLPELEQNLGVRLQLSLLRTDFTLNPANGDTEVSLGLSLR